MTTIIMADAIITMSDAGPDEVAWTVAPDHMDGAELEASFRIVAGFILANDYTLDAYHVEHLNELNIEIAKRIAPFIAAVVCLGLNGEQADDS